MVMWTNVGVTVIICAREAAVVESCGDERAGVVDRRAVFKGDRLAKENEAHRDLARSETTE